MFCIFLAGSWAQATQDSDLFARLEPFKKWKAVGNIELPFETYHPQGLIKIQSRYYLTTVDQQNHVGYLLAFELTSEDLSTAQARLVKSLRFNDNTNKDRYHPSGMDRDPDNGFLWVALAEYREKSSATVYKVDPVTLTETKMLDFSDHLGTVIHDNAHSILRMIDWSTGMYSFPLRQGVPCVDNSCPPLSFQQPGSTQDGYEYQDCKNLGEGYAACSGVKGTLWHKGVVDVIHFDGLAGSYNWVRRVSVPRIDRHQKPVGGLSFEPALTQNPMAYEVVQKGSDSFLRLYFVPHNGPGSRLFVYEAGGSSL